MSETFRSKLADKFVLRLPDGMRPWIAKEAKRNLRSSNAQILWMLQRQIDQTKRAAARAAASSSSSNT